MTIIEKAMLALLISFVLAVFASTIWWVGVGSQQAYKVFAQSCAEAGGVAAWDGRQWQCLKREGGR